jgi:cell division protein FtsQ
MGNEKIPVIRDRKEVRRSTRNRKLLFLLFLFFITILIILFFNSALSKVTEINIKGTMYVEKHDIQDVLGVQLDDQFFLVSTDTVVRNVRKLKGVQSVKVVKSFPGTIVVTVKEYPAVALVYKSDGTDRVLLANGIEVSPAEKMSTMNLPILTGWDDKDPYRIALCKVLSEIRTPHLADISEILPIPTESYPDKLKIYTRSKFEVVTAIEFMEEMMPVLANTIITLKQNGEGPGTITMLEAISYMPFGEEAEEDE